MPGAGGITGTHKTQLISDAIHAFVVLSVVTAVSILAALKIGLPPDVIGTVYGGAIGYAAGRAGNVTRSPLVVPFRNGKAQQFEAMPDAESVGE